MADTTNTVPAAAPVAPAPAATAEASTVVPAAAPETKTFSQDDVSAIAAREAKKAQETLFKKLGLGEDIKSVQDGLAKYAEWQNSQKSELQKATELAAAAAKEKADFEGRLSTLTMENACLKSGVMPDSVSDVALLAKGLMNEQTDASAAIAAIVKKYPQFTQPPAKEPEPGKPVFSTSAAKNSTSPTALDEVRKFMGLKK